MGWAGNGRGQRWGSAFPHYREKPREHRAGQLRPRARSDPTQGPLLHFSRAQLLADRCRSIPRPTRHTAVGRLSEVTAAGPGSTPQFYGLLPLPAPRPTRAGGSPLPTALCHLLCPGPNGHGGAAAPRLSQRVRSPRDFGSAVTAPPPRSACAPHPPRDSAPSARSPSPGPGRRAGPCRIGPRRAEPSRAEPSQGQLGGAGLCRGEPGEIPWRRAGPNGAKPGGAVQGYAVPCRAEPSRAEPVKPGCPQQSRVGPFRTGQPPPPPPPAAGAEAGRAHGAGLRLAPPIGGRAFQWARGVAARPAASVTPCYCYANKSGLKGAPRGRLRSREARARRGGGARRRGRRGAAVRPQPAAHARPRGVAAAGAPSMRGGRCSGAAAA